MCRRETGFNGEGRKIGLPGCNRREASANAGAQCAGIREICQSLYAAALSASTIWNCCWFTFSSPIQTSAR